MSTLALRRGTQRLRRRTAAVLIVLALGAILAVHHSAIAGADMHHSGMGPVVELCLGVFTAVGIAVAAIGLGLRFRRRWDARSRLMPLGVRLVAGRLPLEPRAGPPGQPLLCIWRR